VEKMHNFKESKQIIEEYLKKLDLSKNEVKIFLALIEHKKLSILGISRKTSIERTKLYNLCQSMTNKGLIQEVIGSVRKKYKPSSVSKLSLLIDKQTQKFDFLKNHYLEFTNYLKFFDKKNSPTQVYYHKGVEGIKTIYWNVCNNAQKKYYCFTQRDLAEIIGLDFFKKGFADKTRRGLICRELRSPYFWKSRIGKTKIPLVNDQYRYLPEEIFKMDHYMFLYNDVTAIIQWYENEVFGIEIYNQNIMNFNRQVFEMLWKQGSKKRIIK
jgi:sugar-specific transcriptional regulator TrmB